MQTSNVEQASEKPLIKTDQYLLNMRSMMAHKVDPKNDQKTLCPYVRNAEAAHFQWWPASDGVPAAFVQCSMCWSKVLRRATLSLTGRPYHSGHLKTPTAVPHRQC